MTLESAAKYNGIFSAVAGLLGFFIADIIGMNAYGPSIIAAILFFIAVAVVQSRWRENRGNAQNIKAKKILLDGLRCIFKAKNVFKLCAVQALVEGVIYVFIFLWTPTLILMFKQVETTEKAAELQPNSIAVADEQIAKQQIAEPQEDLVVAAPPEQEVQQARTARDTSTSQTNDIPIGIIFATFMLSMMIGGKLYEFLTRKAKKSNSDVILYSTTIATAAMFWLCRHENTKASTTYLAFLLFQLACGSYYPSMSALRNRIIPQKEASAIAVLVRIPLNLLATFALIYLHNESDLLIGDKSLYFLCACSMGIAMVICLVGNFRGNDNGNPETTTDETDDDGRGIYVPPSEIKVATLNEN